jgi:nitroreductase
METFEAIVTRRSVPAMSPDQTPSKEQIERLLTAAVRAPTHHLSQPWRFIVLTGDALDGFADAWERGAVREGADPSGVAAKAHRAPVILAVIERPHLDNPKVVEIEEHHAVGAALQNILLTAHDMGLGAMLRTGPAARMSEVREYLGVKDDEFVAGFVHLGYPPEGDANRPMSRRTDPSELTEWRGWDR